MVKLYNSFDIDKKHKRSIILIGNFDGVHLGHQRLFNLAELILLYLKNLIKFFLKQNLLSLLKKFYFIS